MERFFKILLSWPKPYLSGTELALVLDQSADSRQGVLYRAVQKGLLMRVRRDLYLIKNRPPVDAFELALILYGPSYVSLESALQFHGWIPEAVPVTTCATTRRSTEFETPIGVFSYSHIPVSAFHMGVGQHSQNRSTLFIADPWKAVADLIYIQKRSWDTVESFCEDLRIERDKINNSDLNILKYLSNNYSNQRVKKELKRLIKTWV